MSRILLAGPNLRDLALHASYLTERGHDVRSTSTGIASLALLRDWRPNLLVMCPDLTWGSGIGVLDVIFEDAICPNMPVILLVDDAVRMRGELLLLENALRLRADIGPSPAYHLLRRPVTPNALYEAANEVLSQPYAVHEPGETSAGPLDF